MHKKRFFWGSVQKYYYYVQKYCLFWGPCRNITIQEPGEAGFSCRAIFGVCADIFIFGEIFTSALQFIEYNVLILCIPDFQREAIKCCRRSSHPFLYCGLLVLRLTIETLSFEMACTLEFVICNSLQHLS